MTKKITDSQRVDWLLDNPGFSCTRNKTNDCYAISTWVANGGPGNENGGGAKFFTKGKTRRDCVDKFIQGNILPELR